MHVFLAGCEMSDALVIVKEGIIKRCFLSFFYLKMKKSDVCGICRRHVKEIIIDSGAHSFFSASKGIVESASVVKLTKKKPQDPDQYFAEYFKWLLLNKDNFDYFVELDIGEIVGQAKVMKWRSQLSKAGLGKKMITVYHPKVVTFKEYIKMLETTESGYVALEGDRRNRSRLPYLKLLKEAYKRGVKVHGFAMTKSNVMDVYPFYSVDSSSWKAGVRFARCMINDNGKIKYVQYKDKKSMFSMEQPILTSKEGVDYYERFRHGALAYQKMGEQAGILWRARGIDWEKVV